MKELLPLYHVSLSIKLFWSVAVSVHLRDSLILCYLRTVCSAITQPNNEDKSPVFTFSRNEKIAVLDKASVGTCISKEVLGCTERILMHVSRARLMEGRKEGKFIKCSPLEAAVLTEM